MLPVMLSMNDESVAWMKWFGAVLILVVGFSLSQFRAQKVRENSWKLSDLIVYFLVPGSLFIMFFFTLLFSNQA